MNKIFAALVAGLFAVGSYAQTPAPMHAPMAKHSKHAKKPMAHKTKHAVKHAKHKAHAV